MNPLTHNLHYKVKRLVRAYFEELWNKENGAVSQIKHETEKTIDAADSKRKPPTAGDSDKQGNENENRGELDGIDTGKGHTEEGGKVNPEKRVKEQKLKGVDNNISSMTQPLEEIRSDSQSKRSSAAETPFDDKNKYLLFDSDLHATVQTRKLFHGGDEGATAESPSPDNIDPEEYSHLIKMTQGSKENLSAFNGEVMPSGVFVGTNYAAGINQDLISQNQDALALVQ